jgi:hypothetical protein
MIQQIKLLIIPFHQPYIWKKQHTTVDFSGQSSRLLMLEEMGNTIKTAANKWNSKSVLLTQMYSATTFFEYRFKYIR